MAIKFISDAWKTNLKSSGGSARDDRFFIDFRQEKYISLDQTNERYELVTRDRNRPGSHTYYCFDGYTNQIATNDLNDNTEWDISATYHTSNQNIFDQRLRKTVWSWTKGSDGSETYIEDLNKDPGTAGTYAATLWFYADIACEVDFGLVHGGGTDRSAPYTTTASEWNLVRVTITTANNPTGISWRIRKSGGGLWPTGQTFRAAEPCVVKNSWAKPSAGTDLTPSAPDNTYLVDYTGKMSGRIIFEPWWTDAQSSTHYILQWELDANRYLKIYYDNGLNISWKNGVNERYLIQNEAVPTTTQREIIVDFAIDTTERTDLDILDGGDATSSFSDIVDGGDATSAFSDIIDGNAVTNAYTTGSQAWIDRSSVSTTWSGAIDVNYRNFPTMDLGQDGGASYLNGEFIYLMLIPNYVASDSDIQNDYKTVLNERIVFDFNGVSWGQTRCGVQGDVKEYSWHGFGQKGNGLFGANRIDFTLYNIDSQYSDNQYTSYDPSLQQYNGEAEQAYLQTRCPVYVQNYYNGDFDYRFVGRVDQSMFTRGDAVNNVSTISVSCDDTIEQVANKYIRNPVALENYKFVDTDNESNSLLHTLTRLSTEISLKNYLGDSGFTSATPSNSWSTTDATISSVAGGLDGTNKGQLVVSTSNGNINQTVVFANIDNADTQYILIGESWTFQFYVKSDQQPTLTYKIDELTSADAVIDTTTDTLRISGSDDWQCLSVTHEVTGDTGIPNKLKITISSNIACTLSLDQMMLFRGEQKIKWYVDNTTEGSSGSIDAENYGSSTYNTIAFDVDDVDITHPWVTVQENTSPWDHINNLSEGLEATYMGMDYSGTFKMRSVLADYDIAESLDTIDSVVSIGSIMNTAAINKVVVKAVTIQKEDDEAILWLATDTNAFSKSNGILQEDVADDGLFPDPDTYGEFWIKYNEQVDDSRVTRSGVSSSKGSGGGRIINYYGEHINGRRVGASAAEFYIDKDKRVIGLKGTIRLAFEWEQGIGVDANWTQVVFDTTSRADACRILYKNESGATATVTNFGLLAKPVYITSQDTYVNDQWENIGNQQKNGISIMDVHNDFIVTKDQADKIAEYRFRKFGKKKHIYEIALTGEYAWLEPGEVYTVDVGTAGEPYAVDAEVEVLDIRIERKTNDIGRTLLLAREIQQKITLRNPVNIRYLANGTINRSVIRQSTIIVAAKGELRPADLYCDGTDDHLQIQAAIDRLSNVNNGGEVKLSKGTFEIAANLEMKENVIVTGEGENTVIDLNTSYKILIEGGEDKCTLQNFKIKDGEVEINRDGVTAILDVKILNMFFNNSYIDDNGSGNMLIDNCLFQNGSLSNDTISIDTSTGLTISNTRILDSDGDGIQISEVVTGENNINNVYIEDATNMGINIFGTIIGAGNILISNSIIKSCGSYGIGIVASSSEQIFRIRINNNNITSNGDHGVYANGLGAPSGVVEYCTINGNTINGNTNNGIYLNGNSDDNVISGNVVTNNTGTGIIIGSSSGDRNVLSGNRATGNTTANFTDNGTNTTYVNLNDFV